MRRNALYSAFGSRLGGVMLVSMLIGVGCSGASQEDDDFETTEEGADEAADATEASDDVASEDVEAAGADAAAVATTEATAEVETDEAVAVGEAEDAVDEESAAAELAGGAGESLPMAAPEAVPVADSMPAADPIPATDPIPSAAPMAEVEPALPAIAAEPMPQPAMVSDSMGGESPRVVRFVKIDQAGIYGGPQVTSGVVGALQKGDRVMIVEEAGWGRIADGMFVKLDELSDRAVPRNRQPAVWYAPGK